MHPAYLHSPSLSTCAPAVHPSKTHIPGCQRLAGAWWLSVLTAWLVFLALSTLPASWALGGHSSHAPRSSASGTRPLPGLPGPGHGML